MRQQPMEESNPEISELMDRYGKQLMNLAYTYCKDWGMSEDIVQEVFISAFKNIDTFKGRSSYKTWLYAITINKSKDFLRKPFMKEPFFQRMKNKVKPVHPTPEEHVIQKEGQHGLAAEVMSLPIKYREVIILHYYDDLSTKEVADLLNIPLSTAKTRIQRGRMALRKQLERGDFLA
ncbi:sigma-70 family RNA polymerase sigma factor [Rossellomorea vietnamensis]|uniref:sigma-70 family RNA polymerase sigma factor n=1 Tax=Rossellomorea vietnamensis TaxID=218284 RepID=UPI001E39E4A8|nr:sigma-70 family RNA polymerase sigma factor [Rossellomorea vietnamensis]MCC5803893.1 sigma-70 family RNA polymerase sigma factor [Rossellomorea vietnamensis]